MLCESGTDLFHVCHTICKEKYHQQLQADRNPAQGAVVKPPLKVSYQTSLGCLFVSACSNGHRRESLETETGLGGCGVTSVSSDFTNLAGSWLRLYPPFSWLAVLSLSS